MNEGLALAIPPVRLTTVDDYFRPTTSRRETEQPWREGLRPRDLVPAGWDLDDVEVVLDGQMARELLDVALQPGQAVTLVRAPGGPVLAAVAVWAATIFISVHAVKQFFGLLIPALPSLRNPNDDSSSVYGWSGPFTNYNAKGLNYPVVYGKHRVGGMAATVFTEVVDGDVPQTYLYVLLVLSVGPIAAVGDIEEDADDLTGDALPEGLLINGNPATNFKDIVAYVRLGSLSQEPIPGFTFVATRYEVNQEIDQVEQGSGLTPVVDWSKAASFDMPLGQVADRAKVTLYFPNGLFRINDNGTLKTSFVQLQVRYQELNDAGNPIGDPVVTTGADHFEIRAKKIAPFPYQIEVPFFEADTFQAPAAGEALRFLSGSNHHGFADSASLKQHVPMFNVAAGTPLEALTVAGFAMARTIKTHNPLVSYGDWDESTTDPHVEGLIVHLSDNGDGTANVRVWWGEGTGALDAQDEIEYVADIEPDVPFFWCVTYLRAAVSGQARVRLYLNGALVAERLSAADIVASDYGLLVNTFPNKELVGSGLWHGQMDVDDLLFYSAELTPSRVAGLHNGGAWVRVDNDPAPADLALAYFMHSGVGFEAPVYPPASATILFLRNGAAALVTLDVVEGFVVAPFETNTPKRARWRVQVQRVDPVKEGIQNHDTVEFQNLIAIVDETIGFAGLALLGLKVLANDQLSGNLPNFTVPVKGRKDIPVFDGVDPDHPGFVLGYSANPAWIQAHLALDKEIGAGHLYDVSRIDWASFKEWADENDVRVYDQRGKFGGPHTEDPLELDYMASGTGLAGAALIVRAPKPIPAHLVVDKEVRLSDLTDPYPSGEFPEGLFIIRNVVSVDDTQYELWLDWPSGVPAPATTPLEDAAAVLVGVEPRRECHLVLGDRGTPYLEARQLVASIGRAKMLTVGDKMRASVAKPKQPVAAFNASNIIAGTFSLASVANPDDFNSAVGEFQDAGQDYQRNVVSRDHPSLEDATSTVSVRRKVLDFRGVTSPSQVHRELAWMLNTSALRRLLVEFEAGRDNGLFLEPGDVFLLSHPLPRWSEGGRCYQDSGGSGSLFYVDVPFVLGQKNMLAHSDDLTEDVWEVTGTPSPVINSTPQAGPAGLAGVRGWSVTFPPSTNTVLRQAVPHRGTGTRYTLIVWARAVAGPTSSILLAISTANQTIVQAAMSLTTTFQRFAVSGISSQDIGTDPDVFGRVRRADTVPGDIEIEVSALRLIVGEDDGEDAVGAEETGALPTYYAAVVDPTNDNAIAFAEMMARAGAFAPGDVVHLASSLGFVPLQDWLWFIGPAEYGALLFEALSVTITQDFRARVRALEWTEDVFPDEEDFQTLDPALPTGGTSALTMAATTLPGAPLSVRAEEESSRDPDTGALKKAILVAWSPDPATASLIDRTALWIQDLTDGGPPERLVEVPGTRTHWRLDASDLDAGSSYRILFQPVTRGGLRTPLSGCVGAVVPFFARMPPPPAPAAVRVTSVGDQVAYEVDLPVGFQGSVVEVFRGGTFIGQPVGRIPVGGDVLGPTDDWCALLPGADGRGSPPLYVRLSGDQGARGEMLVHEEEIVPVGFAAPILADSMEDGPWDTPNAPATEDPILTELDMFDPLLGGPKRLEFATASVALQGTYESTIYDLAAARRAHVSFGVFGIQEAPITADTVRVVGSLRERSLTAEGYLDPGNERFGRVLCFLEWATSLTDDPGSTYRPFRCGVAYLRSCRFRIRLVRPSTAWNAWVTRAGVAIREVPHENDFDAGEVA